MPWLEDLGGAAADLSSYWNTSAVANDGSSYTTEKTNETVPMNAVQSMTPATGTSTDPSWSKFLQDTLGGVVGYAIRKDATANGVPQAATQPAPGTTTTAARPAMNLMPVVLVVGVIVAGAVAYKLVK